MGKSNQTTQLAQIFQILLGSRGEVFICLGSIDIVFCHFLFGKIYGGKTLSEDLILRYIRGQRVFPKKIITAVSEEKGKQKLYEGIESMIMGAWCVDIMRQLQGKVRNYVHSLELDDQSLKHLDANYIGSNANQEQIALYITNVLYYMMLRV